MQKPLRIVIVGGVAGGASAAAKARRVDESADIQVFERGPCISFANCGLPYFIAGEIDDHAKLIVMTPERFWERSRVRAHVNHEVLSINRSAKTICVKDSNGRQSEVPYDKLILSQGATPIVPSIPGVDMPHVFTLRDIPDMDRIARFITEVKPRRAVVIGGGYIGLEMAEAFHLRGLHVTIVDHNPHLMKLFDHDMAVHLQNKIRRDNFEIRTGLEVARLTKDCAGFADGSRLPADLILISVGVKAEVELARAAGLEIGETGGVKTNGRLESSDPNIYAVGDAAETTHALTGARARIALAGPANRQGRTAGANAAGAHLNYPLTLRLVQVVLVGLMAFGFYSMIHDYFESKSNEAQKAEQDEREWQTLKKQNEEKAIQQSVASTQPLESVVSPQPTSSNFGPNAYYAGKDFVERILKAPSSAKFSSPLLDKGSTGWSELGENQWRVYGFVDAQNAFGAMLRQNWSAIVKRNGDDFVVMELTMDGEKVFPP